MAQFECKECGAANRPDARFCSGCDAYLGWDSGAPPASTTDATEGGSAGTAPSGGDDSRAQPPNVELAQTQVVLEKDTGASVELRIRNNSTIVDAYRIDGVDPPKWLAIEQPEIRLMPGENKPLTATFKVKDQAFVEAQTVKVQLRICSLRDTDKYADAEVTLTVPPYGPPVTIRTRPAVVRLVDETTGRIEVILDNSGSNHSRRLVIAGSDQEDVVRFEFSSATVDVAAGGNATVDVRFTVPDIHDGENRTRQLTLSATEDDNTAEAAVTVNQERNAAVPLPMRLEPSVLRVRDCPIADVSLLIDNREGTRDRTLRLIGRDSEGAVQFSFATPEILARAGQMTTTRLSVSASSPPSGSEVSRQFAVVAADGAKESEASGTFVQVTSEPPIKTATLQLAPDTLRRKKANGRYRVFLQNNDNSRWLDAQLYGSDQERMVRFAFSPPRIELPPGGSTWGWVGVAAPLPKRGAEVSRRIEVEASDGRESISTPGTFIQSTSDWVPIVRFLLTVIGALVVIIGACTPWMSLLPDYYVTELPNIGAAKDIVEKTQPATRAAIIILAVTMLIGVSDKGGKATMSAAVSIVTVIVGYFVFVISKAPTGNPMYGAVMVVAGAALGFLGGVLAKR